jgi:hypothetical protein
VRVLVACVGASAAFGLAAASGASLRAEPPTPDAVRPCGSRGDGAKPQQLPSPVGARLGHLVVWPSIRTRVGAAASGAEWPFYVKAPIVLPARTTVTLSVAPEAIDLVGLQAGGYAVGAAPQRRWVSAVRFEACRKDVPAFPRAYRGIVGNYTGFPFGFGLARRSLCVPLDVWLPGETAPIRKLVTFGRACG